LSRAAGLEEAGQSSRPPDSKHHTQRGQCRRRWAGDSGQLITQVAGAIIWLAPLVKIVINKYLCPQPKSDEHATLGLNLGRPYSGEVNGVEGADELLGVSRAIGV
jgi:hypothetical protein